MNGIHDMGGMHGFGPVRADPDEPVFANRWEGRVFGLNQTVGRTISLWKRHDTREWRERLPPKQYLDLGYYECRLMTLKHMLVEYGILTASEIDERVEQLRNQPGILEASRLLPTHNDPQLVNEIVNYLTRSKRKPTRHTPTDAPYRYQSGDRIIARNVHPQGHTRLPRYVRGRPGLIESIRGVYELPDHWVKFRESRLEPVYSVSFAATDLWGSAAASRDKVYLDLWESYLEPAPSTV